MCDCSDGVLCKYHWVDTELQHNTELRRAALDWTNGGKEANAVADLMRYYNPERCWRLQNLHRLGEP